MSYDTIKRQPITIMIPYCGVNTQSKNNMNTYTPVRSSINRFEDSLDFKTFILQEF